MCQALPYSTFCFVCGEDNPRGLKIKFRREDGQVVADFVPDENCNGYRGVVHGGVVTALLDEAMGWAATCQTRRFSHTGELKIRFRSPVPTMAPLQVTARLTRVRGRFCTASAELRSAGGGQPLVEAEGKFMLLSEEETREVDDMLIHAPGAWRIFEETE